MLMEVFSMVYSDNSTHYDIDNGALLRIADELELIRKALQSLVDIQTNEVVKKSVETKKVQANVRSNTLEAKSPSLISIRDLIESKEIPTRVGNVLLRSYVDYIDEFRYLTLRDIKKFHNMGNKSIIWLIEYLEKYSIRLNSDKPELELPVVYKGEQIVYCGPTTQQTLEALEYGSILTAEETVNTTMASRIGFLPRYKCSLDNVVYYLSPSEIGNVIK